METSNNIKNVFKLRAKVLLEGVEVPYSSVSVSYGIDSEPSCTIALPGAITLRELPDCTSVIVIYKDPQDAEDAAWKVLFDGEIEAWNYSMDSNSASMTISAMHGSKWLSLMQMFIQEASAKAAGMDNIAWSGNPGVSQLQGLSQMDSVLFYGMFPKLKANSSTNPETPEFKNMADLIYAIIRSHISDKLWGADTTGFFRTKIEEQYNLPSRIVGRSDTCDTVYDGIVTKIKAMDSGQLSSQNKSTDKNGKINGEDPEALILGGKGGVAVNTQYAIDYSAIND